MFPPYKDDERKHVFMGMQIVKIFPYTSKQTRPRYDELFKNRSIIYIYLLSVWPSMVSCRITGALINQYNNVNKSKVKVNNAAFCHTTILGDSPWLACVINIIGGTLCPLCEFCWRYSLVFGRLKRPPKNCPVGDINLINDECTLGDKW